MKNYLGVDIGSSSIKVAIIDENNNLIDSVYLRNKGVIETLKDAFNNFRNKNYNICGCGTTGSGREFGGIIIGADSVKSEILAHSYSALKINPEVRTLIDIGAEDSKLIIFEDGIINDFRMNSICSSGTGSFLESIGNRIGIKVEDIGDIALKSINRIEISSKCGIFSQSTVVTKLNLGFKKEDIIMGVVRSLVHNYLSMANGIDIKPPIIYQSASAKNKAIVKVFEDELKQKIIVPEKCEIMGAYGMALLVSKNPPEKTKFRGFYIKDINFSTKTFLANGCDNKCEISLIYSGNKYIGILNNRCDNCVRGFKNEE